MRDKQFVVYQISFVGGAVYIGHTRLRVGQTIQAHVARPSNQRLAKLIKQAFSQESKPFQVDRLSTHNTRQEAIEGKYRALTHARYCRLRLLNPKTSQPKDIAPKYTKPKSWDGDVSTAKLPCCICRKRKLASNFYKDKSRTSGYQSRCRECADFVSTHSRQSDNPRKAYYEAKQFIRSGGQLELSA